MSMPIAVMSRVSESASELIEMLVNDPDIDVLIAAGHDQELAEGTRWHRWISRRTAMISQ